jgi:molybdopterin-guanine dinucleotide biosynthesis protein A
MANKTKKAVEVDEAGEALTETVAFATTKSFKARAEAFSKKQERKLSWICRKAVTEYLDRAEA